MKKNSEVFTLAFLSWLAILNGCNAGASYKILYDKSVDKVQAGDNLADFKLLTTFTAESSGHCVGQCSANSRCKAVQFVAASKDCDLFDNFVENSAFLQVGTTTGTTVYEKVPTGIRGAEFSQQPVELKALNDSVYLTSGVCENEVELGIMNHEIPASSFSGYMTCGYHAEKPWHSRMGNYQFGWCGCGGGYLQVDLGAARWVTKVSTSGGSHGQWWVKTFRLKYSNDPEGVHWTTFKTSSGLDKIFNANTDRLTPVDQVLWQPILARWVRFDSIDFNGYPCMRIAVYGCSSHCRSPLGIHSFDVPDDKFSASSRWYHGPFEAYSARLNNIRRCWHEGYPHNDREHIEVDFEKNKFVTGVAIQGAVQPWTSYWITQFSVQYQPDYNNDWYYALDNTGNRLFTGSVNWNQAVFQYFSYPVVARKFRIITVAGNSWVALRFELLGCNEMDGEAYLTKIVNPSTSTATTSQTVRHKAISAVIDDDKDTCSRITAQSPTNPSVTIDLGSEKDISEVYITPLDEPELNPDGAWIFDIFARGHDLSGNGNHVHMSSTVTFIDDPFGRPNGAAHMEGESALMFGAHFNGALATAGDHSFFAWVKVYAGVTAFLTHFPMGTAGWGWHAILHHDTFDPFYRQELHSDIATGLKYLPLPVDTWVHVGFVTDVARNRIMTFYNGEPDTEHVMSFDWTVANLEAFTIGRPKAYCQDNNRDNKLSIYCLQIYNRALTRREILATMRCPWADYRRPIALLTLDDENGATDISGNGFDATITGASLTSFAQFPNKAYSVTSSLHKVSLAQTSLFSKLTRSFSILVHFICTNEPCRILHNEKLDESDQPWRVVFFQTNGYHGFQLNCGGSWTYMDIDIPRIAFNVPYYAGFTYDYPTRIVTFYFEGQAMGTMTIPDGCAMAPVDGQHYIGIRGNFGKMACLQIYDTALSQREVNMVGACPMTVVPDMKALAVYDGHDTFVCSGSPINMVKPLSGPVFTNYNGWDWGGIPSFAPNIAWPHHRSMCTNGVNQYFEAVSDTDMQAVTGPFTLMTYVYIRADANDKAILRMRSGTTGWAYGFNLVNSPLRVYGSAYCAAGSNVAPLYSGTLNVNTWYHLALVYDPPNSLLRLVIDGASITQSTSATDCTLRTPTHLMFGYTQWSNGYFNGCFSCIRLFNHPLSLEEINDMRNSCPLPSQVEPKQCNNELLTPGGTAYASSFQNNTGGSGYDWGPLRGLSIHNTFDLTNGQRLAGGWRPLDGSNSGSFIRISLPGIKRVTAVAAAGISDTGIESWYTKTFIIKYAQRGGSTVSWVVYKDRRTGGNKIFSTNTADPTVPIRYPLTPELTTQDIMVQPQTWQGNPVLRVEFYGCDPHTCAMDLLTITSDSKITAYGYDTSYEPKRGYIGSGGYWKFADNPYPAPKDFVWWQADFASIKKITVIKTQGAGGGYITKYYFRFSRDGTNWDGHKDKDGFLKMLDGNTDTTSIVSHTIGPYYQRFVRFYPQDYNTVLAGRFGVYGCTPSKYSSSMNSRLTASYSNNAGNLTENLCSTATTDNTGSPIKLRCKPGASGQFLTISTTHPADLEICEISATSDPSPKNLVDARKPSLVGTFSIDSVNAVSQGYITNNVTDGLTANSLTFDVDATLHAYFDLGAVGRVTRAVLVLSNEATDTEFSGLDLKVGNTTDIADSHYCDTVNANVFSNGGIITLWCLEPAYGRYVFIQRSSAVTNSPVIPIAEIMVY